MAGLPRAEQAGRRDAAMAMVRRASRPFQLVDVGSVSRAAVAAWVAILMTLTPNEPAPCWRAESEVFYPFLERPRCPSRDSRRL
jgi:hypothetical protein